MPRSTQSQPSKLRMNHNPLQQIAFSPRNQAVPPGSDVAALTGFPAHALVKPNLPAIVAPPAPDGVTVNQPAGSTSIIGKDPHTVLNLFNTGAQTPGQFFADVAADMQAHVDAMTNAFQAAVAARKSGHTLNDLSTAAQTIPPDNVTGTLGEPTMRATTQNFFDHLVNAFGTPGTGHVTADIDTAATTIPPDNIVGTLGGPTMRQTIQNFLDGMFQGTNTQSTTGHSIADLSSGMSGLATLLGWNPLTAPHPSSVAGITSTNASYIVNRAATRASYIGVDPSGDPTFNFSHLQGASLPTIPVTSANSVIGIIGTPDGGLKQSVAWLGSGTTNITSMVINVYQINTTSGVATPLSSSPNIIASVNNALLWNYYDFPVGQQIVAQQGNWYAVEMVVAGTGTYTLAGIPHTAPPNTNVFPSQLGAKRVYGLPVAGNASPSAASNSGNVTSLSYIHTPTVGDNGLVAYVQASASTAAVSAPTSVTYNGIPMTLQGSQIDVFATRGSLWGYVLTDQPLIPFPTGPQQILVTFSGAVKPKVAHVEAQSFTNVGGFGAAQSISATSANFTQTVTGTTNDVISQAFGFVDTTSGTIINAGTYSQNQMDNEFLSFGTTISNGLTIGWAPGGASVVFTATANSAANYAAMAIPVIGNVPETPTPIVNLNYTTNIPFFELCGLAGISQQTPDITQLTVSGTYTLPPWVRQGNFVDIVIVGGGAGGGAVGAFPPIVNHSGGGGGSWTAITLIYGTHIPLGVRTFTVTIGAGGAGSTALSGSPGGATTVTIAGYGMITAAGGAPLNGTQFGGSPGNEIFGPPGATFNTLYFGGQQQRAHGNFASPVGGNGNTPGGGGSQGQAGPFIFFPYAGGTGAPGSAWITAYQ